MATPIPEVNHHPIDHPTAVLAHSRHAGSHLLVLLVIAINAGPHGIWIADQATLQTQARLSRRRTQRILADLAAAGELAYVPGKGRGNRSTFQLLPPSPPFPPDPLSPPTPQNKNQKQMRPSVSCAGPSQGLSARSSRSMCCSIRQALLSRLLRKSLSG